MIAEIEKLRREREQLMEYTENLQGSLKHYAAQNVELERQLEQSAVDMCEGKKEARC